MLAGMNLLANPVDNLLERIDKGASKKFETKIVPSKNDYFELDQNGNKVVVRGNSYVSIAAGINWYLKYYANIHLSWNGMTAKLPTVLPAVAKPERRETTTAFRFYFNYCTFSYSMAFWDWKRWEKEIDWMALHGINLPLALVGTEAVWFNLLKKLGYSKAEINDFIAGPAFLPWWHMNNLEGWGGPNTDNWYAQQIVLQKKILKRLREFGMEPVLPGYSGMIPNNAKEKLGLNVQNPGEWGGFKRPAFLQPTDERFAEIADLFYAEMNSLFGKVKYYSMDPFHEGGSTKGVDLEKAGKAIMGAMKRNNPEATWVVQAWQANPRMEMFRPFNTGDALVIDLFSEARPQWGDPKSTWYRKDGFEQHSWIFSMILNFGGNVGLFGKMDRLIDGYYLANTLEVGKRHLKGVGATMEAIENNPVMFELLLELPWRKDKFMKEEWLKGYARARYGAANAKIDEAWRILSATAYNPPYESTQEGSSESILSSRPNENISKASTYGVVDMYYKAEDLLPAARLMLEAAPAFKGNNNYEYDLVDVVRQTLTDRAKTLHIEIIQAYKAGDKIAFDKLSKQFLQLILDQDRLLATRPEFMVGTWIAQARTLGKDSKEKDWLEWNARTLITIWGKKDGGLIDYSHREWSGILRDLHYSRWNAFFSNLKAKMEGKNPERVNYFAIEEGWTKEKKSYPTKPSGNSVAIAKEVFTTYFK